MIKKIFIQKIQPCRLRISNKMNLVTFLGQGFSQFCRYYATTTKGRVTDDADFNLIHVVKLVG